MRRDVEVLREMLANMEREQESVARAGALPETVAVLQRKSQALTAAIAALEAEETRNLHCPGCDGDHAP